MLIMKHRDTRSPLDRLIDAACGIPNGPPKSVVLVCQKCKKEKRCRLDKTDPKGTVRIELTCPDCWTDGSFETAIFFNKNGKQIFRSPKG